MKKVLAPALLLLLNACTSGDEAPYTDRGPDARSAEIIAADQAFAALARTEGLEAAYREYLAVDAVQLPDGGLPLTGKDAILANVAAVVAEQEFTLSWEPEDARISASGDLGFSWGYYVLETSDLDGQAVSSEGKYATVWHKAADGKWQVVLDVSNQNEALFDQTIEFDFGDLSDELLEE